MLTAGKYNVIHKQLVDKEKIVPPPDSYKAWFDEAIVKALDMDGVCF